MAYGIPALSFAAGSTKIDDDIEGNELDMDKLREVDNVIGKWPNEREKEEWWHSDFKNVAYLYTYGLYDDMVEQAKLR